MAYTSEKPNFCQKCGKGFAGATASVSAQAQPELDEAAEGGEGESVPQLNGLDFEITNITQAGVTMEQIFQDAQRQDEAPQADPNNQGEFANPQEAIEQLKREGGPLRPKNAGSTDGWEKEQAEGAPSLRGRHQGNQHRNPKKEG